VIAYASRTLNPAERNYSATELECLAVVWGIRRMRDYLEGYHFTVLTDHQSLRWLQRLEAPTGRLGRWFFELQQYDFEIQYRRGSQNQVADALSRTPQVGAVRRGAKCCWYDRLVRGIKKTPPNTRTTGWLVDICTGTCCTTSTSGISPRTNNGSVSKAQRDPLLKRLHDEPASGHLGTSQDTSPCRPDVLLARHVPRGRSVRATVPHQLST